MEIIVIAAMAANRVIGCQNSLPWDLPSDLVRFKRLTMGHALIMGRRTYESIGRTLPGRRTVVVTRNRQFRGDGCCVAKSLEEALLLCRGSDRVFIAGGGEMYRQALPFCDSIILTVLHRDVEGDVWFPLFDEHNFAVERIEEVAEADPYTVFWYRRRSKLSEQME